MPPRNRPTAFEVSFGVPMDVDDDEEAPAQPAPVQAAADPLFVYPAAPLVAGERNAQAVRSRQAPKKRPRQEKVRTEGRTTLNSYAPTPEDIKEFAGTTILGEDPDELFDAGGKPVRNLTDFDVFEPLLGFQLVSLVLDDISGSGGSRRKLECAGFVSPVSLNEEDEGQEDGLDDDDRRQRLRTSVIAGFSVDYARINGPLYVETEFGWYILKSPSESYRPLFVKFYRPHRIAQLAVSAALESVLTTYAEFQDLYVDHRDDVLDDFIELSDLQDAIPIVQALVNDNSVSRKTASHPIIHHLLTSASLRTFPRHLNLKRPGFHHLQPSIPGGTVGNLDIAVLRPENQNPTMVTPFIDSLALGLFHERLQVLGPPPRKPSEHEVRTRRQAAQRRLRALLYAAIRHRADGAKADIFFPAADRLHDEYWRAVRIDGEMYEVGDCIIIEAGPYKNRKVKEIPVSLDQLPEDAHIADYFWFAKIIHINQQRKRLHVQWYEHSSKTFLEEICNLQELFLCPVCDNIRLEGIRVVGKAVVHDAPPRGTDMDPTHFFSRFMYDEAEANFTDGIDKNVTEVANGNLPPNNCPSCVLAADHIQEQECDATEDRILYLGVTYHKDDYALFRSDKGPADIGRIIRIKPGKTRSIISFQMFGRVTDIIQRTVPRNHFMNERELFMTDMVQEADAKDLLQRCIVLHHSAVEDLDSWEAISPLHFHVKYRFPTLRPSWDARTELRASQIPVCVRCYKESNARIEEYSRLPCLRAFDPFAGVAAFCLPMEETGCLKLTHAIEISPSAADTLRKNCPSAQVFNQCSNIVLQYAIKSHAGQAVTPPKDLEEKEDLPPPPQPGQIDCIVAGFPCQPHSSLNMFQYAHNRKSHLILTLLSWVDFLRPKYCYFENVKGFLGYRLRASQAGRYNKFEGGILMGGLKFFVYALLAMGYQCRFALLQAGHYGTPQLRTRFFLIASQRGYPLPRFPQPSHSAAIPSHLEINFPNGASIRPILTADGTAPCKYVSIEDAIGDLVPFDWENPKKLMRSATQLPRYPTVKCEGPSPNCGPRGDYSFEPRNSYQRKCRERPTEAIQHFTRVLKAEVVERVINVKLEAMADYRDFNPKLWEWLSSHPTSAVARKGFHPGFYGRLDRNDWFRTTVTNVEPTAKQSYIVHPWCQRVLTVRELARSQGFPDWFVFVARGERVKTMQRQIGNAVPWPVGRALGRELREAMLKKHMQSREEAIDIAED